ncbi:murein L,D-transpeptidase catalytic domain family protein [Flavobacterium sp. Fl-318]|uniref:Murein L,D-transpeptidase catalytic domain family protein n=1 Tax=Flavobacterium cupriresistens TaxID=2893885 RepID=A0ABU4RBK8_9FLAO|nr:MULTISPECIES: murein L,D-transpeptidase catalytic domain family protein [unclassified Flavobacterium]MDX6188820.1 murein L,D-transpeptidase catalytic domain family protein [Flavobacterium sp. Fl-318]UFH44394.1 murein L,D-transpeptidase catalytic domain family protein [Flavobacterium sp. F-323]
MTKKIAIIPKNKDRGIHVETLQKRLLDLGFNPNGVDGIFGNGTAVALKKFQSSSGLSDTGIIDTTTLSKLDLEVKVGQDNNHEIAITDIVDRKDITNTDWKNRGKAVWGYYYGMALMFAVLYKRLKNGDPLVKEMAKALHSDRDRDALKRFDTVFAGKGMKNDNGEEDRLRHLFVLMFGLGVMESNGKHCAGRDITMNFDHGDDTEAGLFQTSYNVRSVARDKLSQVFETYRSSNTNGFLEYFKKGFKSEETENYGAGDAYEFQKLSKECPAFSIEFTAIALRNVSNHWAPVKHIGDIEKGLEINSSCNELLKQVQEYVDTYGFNADEINLVENTREEIAPIVATEPKSELKEIALNKANELGQKEQLEKLFDSYPESTANYWAVVDFNKPSSEKRFFIFNLKNKNYKSYLVAHGKNSGESYARNFSNVIGSNQSSLGIYKTAETYNGEHGLSLRLDGQEAVNSNVRARAIVIHKADYVVPNYKGTSRAGRSEGCLAVNPADIDEVIANLKNGSYIIAWTTNA